MIKILLDCGHYKNYNKGKFTKYYEGNMTIQLGKKLKNYLENNYNNIKVGLTHNGLTTEMGLYQRGIMSKGYDMFLSLHSNSCDNALVDRVVIIAPHNDKTYDKFAKEFGDIIKKCICVDQNTQVYRREYKGTEYYGVLRGAKEVGCKKRFIVEHSFHSNEYVSKWLYDEKNLDRLAKAEGDFLAKYFGLQKKSDAQIIRVIKEVNFRSKPEFKTDCVKGVAKVGECFTVVSRVTSDSSTDMFKLLSGYYITTSNKYVEIIK